jgi:thioredoxin-dependent peroxiredoxin
MLNSKAPDFSLEASNGQKITLNELAGAFVVLIFYPMNDSPNCNKQLKETDLNIQEFLLANTRVFGVNTAPVEKQREYCIRRRLSFPILSDPGGKTAKKYKAHMLWLPFNLRTVVVVDPNGNVCYWKRGLPSASEIIEAIKAKTMELKSAALGEAIKPHEPTFDKG